jgi:hypothetical protein
VWGETAQMKYNVRRNEMSCVRHWIELSHAQQNDLRVDAAKMWRGA